MTIKERTLAALRWQEPDRVPLGIYLSHLARGSTERRLREAGLGLIYRLPAHRLEHRQAEILTREYQENGRKLIRRTIRTPVGEVWQTLEPERAYQTSNWIREHFIKGPEDYRAMEYYIRDGVYSSNRDALSQAQREIGEDGVVLVRIAKSPLQEMLIQMMGHERFAIDLAENRERFDSLHAVMAARWQELYELAAAAPAEIVQLADNVTADVVGVRRFEEYLRPEYRKLRAALAGTGKLAAVHMDGRLRALRGAIAAAEFDIVEALTPPPVGDVSIHEARQRWPDKALWVNFTSSVHIEPPEAIAAHTRQLVEEAGTRRGFALSVTEDVPVEALDRSLEVIARVLQE